MTHNPSISKFMDTLKAALVLLSSTTSSSTKVDDALHLHHRRRPKWHWHIIVSYCHSVSFVVAVVVVDVQPMDGGGEQG
jgi:hypothetical protein